MREGKLNISNEFRLIFCAVNGVISPLFTKALQPDRRTDGRTDRRTDGRTHPLIVMLGASKNENGEKWLKELKFLKLFKTFLTDL